MADEITIEVCYMSITSWEGCCGKGNKHKERSSNVGTGWGYQILYSLGRKTLKRDRSGIVQAVRNKKKSQQNLLGGLENKYSRD